MDPMPFSTPQCYVGDQIVEGRQELLRSLHGLLMGLRSISPATSPPASCRAPPALLL